MKKFLIAALMLCFPWSLICLATPSSNTATDAKQQVVDNAKKETPTTIVTAKSNTEVKQIILYETPSLNSKIVAKVELSQILIPIYKQEGWVKVGNPNNGTVGWVNIEQYSKIISDLVKPIVQTIYVQTNKGLEKGKEQITVYENGIQVDQKRAEELLKQINSKQADTQKQFADIQKQMEEMFNNLSREFNNFPVIPVMPKGSEPIVIVVKPQEK